MATISHIIENINKKIEMGTSLVVQWLRLHPSNPGGLGLISGQETVLLATTKSLHATAETWHSQINKYIF